ncbi:hypothetical protein [Flavobacterium sp.]|uniref:hypothetical protein n=1 Tax=Flavobacterium sp. TaxID=239 RepID=UPI0028BE9232|nr:hypothetical protein [Flavobacterium sp.]
MKNILILITLILVSCNSNDKSKSESDVTSRVLINDNNKYNSYLIENLNRKVRESSKNSEIVKYDSLTKNYLNYLSEVETEITNKSSEIFFQGDEYSSKGKEFISKTNAYKTEIEKIVESENLKKRINLVLNTNDVQQPKNVTEIAENNETNNHAIGEISIFYLDYYYKGSTKYQSLSFLSSKKRSILEIENEFIISYDK